MSSDSDSRCIRCNHPDPARDEAGVCLVCDDVEYEDRSPTRSGTRERGPTSPDSPAAGRAGLVSGADPDCDDAICGGSGVCPDCDEGMVDHGLTCGTCLGTGDCPGCVACADPDCDDGDDDDGWRFCEGCGCRKPDAAPTRWSDHDWCDDCNGGRAR